MGRGVEKFCQVGKNAGKPGPCPEADPFDRPAAKRQPALDDHGYVFEYPDGFAPARKGAGPNKKLADSRPRVTATEAEAVHAYTTEDDGTYKRINDALRAGKEPSGRDAEVSRILGSAFAKAKPLPEPVKVYRGMRLAPADAAAFAAALEKNRAAGAPVRMPGYLSTTTNEAAARDFGNVRIEIEAVKGLDASPYSEAPSEEEEFLIDHNTEFAVKAVEKAGGGYVVRLAQRVPQ